MTLEEVYAVAPDDLPKHGEIGRGRNRDSVTTSNGKRDKSYLAARIKRDHPDICKRIGREVKIDNVKLDQNSDTRTGVGKQD